MENLSYLKKLFGIVSDDPLVLYAMCILVLAVFSVLCFINILWYVYVKYFLSNNEKLLKIIEKRVWLKRIIKSYNEINTWFIIFELISYFVCTGTVIQTSLKIIYYSS